ncbi:uncharacterized protein [Oscarella lobularis]|uniref:uncharacterized protein n=1 Tax=Oscarella lobularis TaxID=121494 RepID=UPI003313505C
MVVITARPLDLLIVASFGCFFVIAVTIDILQASLTEDITADAVSDRTWPPEWIRRSFLWWCTEVDTLVEANPLWYRALALTSPFLYAPFYVLAIYAFINEREWIKIPGLCWSWGLILVMFPTFAEQLAGEHATKHVGLFLVAYLPYVVFPLLFAARLAIPSTVFSPDSSLVKKRS